MGEHVACLLLRVGNAKARARARHSAGVADLATRFGIERRLVEDDGAVLARLQARDLLAVLYDGDHDAFGALGLVAQELAGAGFFPHAEPDRLGCRVAGALPGFARLLALALHG